MLKLFLDETCGKRVEKALIEAGMDVVGVIGLMNGAKDDVVLKRAREEGRILVTNDKDFGELVYRKGLPYEGVILLRLKYDSVGARITVIKRVVMRYQGRLKGKFVVATEKKIRLR